VTVFFTADTHFGHGGASGIYRRPFASVAAMDLALILAWNAVVDEADTVWHLGDFAVRQTPERVSTLLQSLHGTKHLITGNNDDTAVTTCPLWSSVRPYAELTEDGIPLVLCHYAFRTWRGMAKGAWNLHGHSHGRLKPLPRQADVGVDARGFRPVEVRVLISRS
jgi:calcineurin-like phosphoesterase family protein